MKELRILNGPSAGSSFALFERKLCMGKAAGCTVLLTRRDAADYHAQVILDENGQASILPRGGSVYDYKGVELSHELALDSQTPFYICNTWYVVQSEDEAWPVRLPVDPAVSVSNKGSNVARRKGIAKRALLYLTLVSTVFISVSNFAYSSKIDKAYEAREKLAQQGVETYKFREAELVKAESIVRKMLEEREIYGVDVFSSDFRLYVSGTVSSVKRQLLSRMVSRYNRDYGEFELINQASEIVATVPLNLSSVVSGTRGRIVTTDGEVVLIGQTIDGYLLMDISVDTISLRKGDENLEIKW